MKKKVLLIFAVIILMILISCDSKNGEVQNNIQQSAVASTVNEEDIEQPLVTFLEFGSTSCMACLKMQPLLKSVEKKYGNQIKVIFYDVWKAEQKQYAKQYGIRLIPTQVFLNSEGKEIYRHEGYIPEEEVDRLLKENGLKIKDTI